MSYDEFILKYIDHIEGRADAEERRPFSAEEGVDGKPKVDEEGKMESITIEEGSS
jgi:hypothetical protein